jgi:hypothetical protein
MNYEEALREIDSHIRSTSDPIPHIIETLKNTLPEYEGGNGMTKNLNEMSYGELIECQTQVNEAVRQRAYHEGYKQGRADEALDAVNGYYEQSQPPTRDEIVGQAIHDFADIVYENHLTADETEIIVNKEKRTVVALLKNPYKATVHARGIAKCDPSDCFNVHIGKAIALRRALGLDVPSEYLNAPQPTEVRVGDVVEWKNIRSVYRIDGISGVNYDFTNLDSDEKFRGFRYNDLLSAANIIDDSREVAE